MALATSTPSRQIAQADKDLIQLLLTYSNAKAVLDSLGLSYSALSCIEHHEDLDSVEIRYSIVEGNAVDFKTVTVSITSFLPVFFSPRRHRGQFYEVALEGRSPPAFKAWDQKDSGKSPHLVWHDEGGWCCSCMDYANQRATFLQSSQIWNAIAAQPACKHIFAVANDQQVELAVELLSL